MTHPAHHELQPGSRRAVDVLFIDGLIRAAGPVLAASLLLAACSGDGSVAESTSQADADAPGNIEQIDATPAPTPVEVPVECVEKLDDIYPNQGFGKATDDNGDGVVLVSTFAELAEETLITDEGICLVDVVDVPGEQPTAVVEWLRNEDNSDDVVDETQEILLEADVIQEQEGDSAGTADAENYGSQQEEFKFTPENAKKYIANLSDGDIDRMMEDKNSGYRAALEYLANSERNERVLGQMNDVMREFENMMESEEATIVTPSFYQHLENHDRSAVGHTVELMHPGLPGQFDRAILQTTAAEGEDIKFIRDNSEPFTTNLTLFYDDDGGRYVNIFYTNVPPQADGFFHGSPFREAIDNQYIFEGLAQSPIFVGVRWDKDTEIDFDSGDHDPANLKIFGDAIYAPNLDDSAIGYGPDNAKPTVDNYRNVDALATFFRDIFFGNATIDDMIQP